MPLTKEDEEIFKQLRAIKYRELMKEQRDQICYKCKTPLSKDAKECPKCGTKKKKYGARKTRKFDK